MKNKNLAIAVGVSLVIMMVSVFASLFFIYTHIRIDAPTTGKASFDQGMISVEVTGVLSIIADDSVINFQGCSPGHNIYSNITHGGEHLPCPGHSSDSIIIRNDGDIAANVTVNLSNWGAAQGGTFLSSALNNSQVWYGIRNTAIEYEGGCLGMIEDGWHTIMNGSEVIACELLSSHAQENSFTFDLAFYVPEDVESQTSELEIVFYAKAPI